MIIVISNTMFNKINLRKYLIVNKDNLNIFMIIGLLIIQICILIMINSALTILINNLSK